MLKVAGGITVDITELDPGRFEEHKSEFSYKSFGDFVNAGQYLIFQD